MPTDPCGPSSTPLTGGRRFGPTANVQPARKRMVASKSPRVREHSEELQRSVRSGIGSGTKLRDGVQKFPETEGLFEIPNSPHLIHRPCRFKPASDHQDRHFVAAPTEGLNEATPIKHWHLQVENDERRRVNSGQLQRIAPVRSAKHGMPLRP